MKTMHKYIKATVLATDTNQAYVNEGACLKVYTFDEVIEDAINELDKRTIVAFKDTAKEMYPQLLIFLRAMTGIVYIEISE